MRWRDLNPMIQNTKDEGKDSDIRSKVSFNSTATTLTDPYRQVLGCNNANMSRQMIENVPTFNGKQGELMQSLSTIKLYSKLYGACKVEITLLCTRQRPHEVISHALQEDPNVECLEIKTKLTSNYGITKSRIDASLKIRDI